VGCGPPLSVVAVTVSMRVMSAGHGYRYLLDSVAVGDGAREVGRPLTDYYTADGCPPGRWLGAGLAGLDGTVRPGDVVGEEQLAWLVGEGRDPTSGTPLGHAYPTFPTRQVRIARRIASLDAGLAADARAVAVALIEAEEAAKPVRRAVAGYDLTFSAPKSVSLLWALADPDVRHAVEAAHHAAIADVISLVERDVAATRMGANGPDGAVAQVEVAGVIAAAFDHYDSRAGDPQMHTHLVIANKVQTLMDGRWRSLDGRPIHAAMVALSEHYNAVLADHLTTTLGVVWQPRERGRDRNPGWEIANVPPELLDVFASRSSAIETEKDRLIAAYVEAHGRQPSPGTLLRLRQQATLATRPDKQLHSLAALQARWRATASAAGHAPASWVPHVLAPRAQQLLHAEEVSDATVAGVARQVVHVVGERRSTWRRWNLHAEASRQLMGVRFATTTDRDITLNRVVAAAEAASVRLSPPDLASVPLELQRTDGTSVLRPRHATVFTSAELLAAEDELIRLGRTTTGPALPALTVAAHTNQLAADQAVAVTTVATSGRVVDVLVGPAGAGKTTTMRTLRQAWTHLYGDTTVVGLAPSAAAAEVLSAELAVPAETLAKWLHDRRTGHPGLHAGQLVIIDEASLAGTRALHEVAKAAHRAGAKLLLVGDPGQLAAVDAGGAFDLLVRDRDDVAELTAVRRFHQPWEATATLQLRRGDTTALDTYSLHGRLHDGDTDQMLDAAYTAWQTDIAGGHRSLLIAPTRDQVIALNMRAQADLLATGHIDHTITVALHDGTTAGTGDTVVTRGNDRRLTDTAGRWVRNGDRWTITAIHPDGSIHLHPAGKRGRAVQLPTGYVAAHLELGYATTAHRVSAVTDFPS
jgi:conjugative relaxase-like TrwC/TraI family protein